MLVKYGVKTKITQYFKEFQDYKKRLFVLLTSSGMIDPVIHSLKKTRSLKILDFIKYKNTEFVRKCLWQENMSIFNEMFQNHHYNTSAANNYQLDFPPTQTTCYRAYSFRKKAAEAWNKIQRMSIPDLLNCEFTDFKKEILWLCYNKYYS